MKNFKTKAILTFTLFFFNIIFSKSNSIDEEQNFSMIISMEKNISKDSVGKESLISGHLKAKIDDNILLRDYIVNCDIIGRVYQGRSFSCGFSEVEDIKGLCVIKNNKNDIIITEWNCITNMGMSGDAICKGKANILSGFGIFAGIKGNANITMPLIKNVSNEQVSTKGIWKAKFYLPDRL